MPSFTLRACLARWLQSEGALPAEFIVVRRWSNRYEVWTHPKHPHLFYFLGEAGALRVGRAPGSSVPVLDSIKALRIEHGRRLLESEEAARKLMTKRERKSGAAALADLDL